MAFIRFTNIKKSFCWHPKVAVILIVYFVKSVFFKFFARTEKWFSSNIVRVTFLVHVLYWSSEPLNCQNSWNYYFNFKIFNYGTLFYQMKLKISHSISSSQTHNCQNWNCLQFQFLEILGENVSKLNKNNHEFYFPGNFSINLLKIRNVFNKSPNKNKNLDSITVLHYFRFETTD